MFGEGTWQEQLVVLYSLDYWWGYIARFVTIILLTLVALVVAQRNVRRFFRFALRDDRIIVSERRARTLEGLLSGLTSFIIISIAIIWGLLLLDIAEASYLFPALGLFSAGFGLGARPLVSDYLAGITLLFEYSYAFGEKVEIMDVIGTVEAVGIRTTVIRADSGELFVVPNGDVRVIRNFSRGTFSPASVRVTVAPRDLRATIAVLEQVAEEASEKYDELLVERPEIISETGELSDKTQLTLVAKARFTHGAELRRKLIADVHDALAAVQIEEVG
ncbi:MAG: mechanosensitive ion channel family protein [Chloroflexota bacterium]|nr:mechanosensitive ion channel family protein [Chloroflexota bacterium]